MTTRILQPGDCVVDYSFSRPRPNELVDAGVKAVSRYISGFHDGKPLERAERDALWAAGLGILLNWERDAGAALAGAEKGAQHGAMAAADATALEYPRSLPICVSVDVGVGLGQLQAVADYFDAFQTACPWPITFYGGTYVGNYLVDHGLASGIWKASASSWSPRTEPTDHVFLEQHIGYPHTSLIAIPQSIDDNTVIRPFAVWTGLEPDVVDAGQSVTPTPMEDDMAYTVFDIEGTDVSLVVQLDANGLGEFAKWLPTPEARAKRVALHAPVQSRPITDLANTTLLGPLPCGDRYHEWTGSEFDSHIPSA